LNKEVLRVSPEVEDLTQAEKRLSEIQKESERIFDEAEHSYQAVRDLVKKALARAVDSRKQSSKLADLNAEAAYLRVKFGISGEGSGNPEIGADQVRAAWRQLESALQPGRPSSEWLEKIREAESKKAGPPVLSDDERQELERRLKENVCPICVSYALDGSCTLQAFEECPITTYLNHLVTMIEEMGHRPWMEDYFERMYRDICPGCSGRVDKDHCPPREEGDCSIFTYLPTVVRTIEQFMKEKSTGSLYSPGESTA
jgi:hypothetical protein